jgi:hypothetical protein
MQNDDLSTPEVRGHPGRDGAMGRGWQNNHKHLRVLDGFFHLRCDQRQARETVRAAVAAFQVDALTGFDAVYVFRGTVI